MANHSSVKFPWAVDFEMMEALAREVMRAGFGGYFVRGRSDDNVILFEPVEDTGPGFARGEAYVWSDGPRHLEMRGMSATGLPDIARRVLFDCLAAGFGCAVSDDDGKCRVQPPARQSLWTDRWLCFTASAGDGWPEDASHAPSWGLEGKGLAVAKRLLDPAFFAPSMSNAQMESWRSSERSMPRPSKSDRLRVRADDAYDIGPKMDWGAALAAAFGPGALDSKRAFMAALPCAAFDLELPALVAKSLKPQDAAKALGEALMWGSGKAARSIAGLLSGPSGSKDPSKSMEDAWGVCSKLWAARLADKDLGDWDRAERASSLALFEALEIERAALRAAPKAPKRRPGI